MQEPDRWQGLPYFPISQFYQRLFGERVFKIPVSVAQTCPNREGLKGMKTCIFCDPWGSAAYPEAQKWDLRKQIERNRDLIKGRTGARKFMVYFQAYTTTFARVKSLREQFMIAAEYPEVVGFVVGTRPDCVSEALLDLWNEINKDYFLAVELGAQSFDNEQLSWLERGHTAERTIQAITRIKARTTVDLGVHLMFGLPGESDRQIVETARLLNSLPVDNVKLHNLHVLRNTPLEQAYKQGLFAPIDRENYTDRVILFLQHLDPRIAVHRLAALSSRPEELVAPAWTARKMETYQYMIDRFRERRARQGQFIGTNSHAVPGL